MLNNETDVSLRERERVKTALHRILNVYHIANLYFHQTEAFPEHFSSIKSRLPMPGYYATRLETYISPDILDEKSISDPGMHITQSTVGLLDQAELDQMISAINWNEMIFDLRVFTEFIEQRGGDEVVDAIRSRLQRVCKNIVKMSFLTGETEKEKMVAKIMFQLNGIFKDYQGKSMPWGRGFIAWLIKNKN